jgi:hypothetical protein
MHTVSESSMTIIGWVIALAPWLGCVRLSCLMGESAWGIERPRDARGGGDANVLVEKDEALQAISFSRSVHARGNPLITSCQSLR